MPSKDLASWEVLSEFIFERVGITLNPRSISFQGPHRDSTEENLNCWGGINCKQYPDELGKTLAFLYAKRKEINSYCEIGVERLGTFCVIDSFLRAVNPNMGKSLAVDIQDRHFSVIKEYQIQNVNVHTLCVNSLDFTPDQEYDFCFIDGGHSYDYVSSDFNLMKNHSKYIKEIKIDLKII